MIQTVWRILQDADEADDALQNARTRIWENLPRVRKASNPHGLILKICVDAAYDRLRKRIQDRQRRRQLAPDAASNGPGPSRKTELDETYGEIMNAIGQLARYQAVAILMRLVHREPYSTIAEALGCGEASARKHVARGRRRLQKLLRHLTTPHSVSQEPD